MKHADVLVALWPKGAEPWPHLKELRGQEEYCRLHPICPHCDNPGIDPSGIGPGLIIACQSCGRIEMAVAWCQG